MNKEPIVAETTVNASVSKVWSAITDKDKMKEWYFDLKEFKPEVGFEFDFTGGTEDKQYLHLCRITEVIPEKKLTHTWMYENVPVETRVTWQLTSAGNDQTHVRLTHEGVNDFPADNKDFAKENFVAGWNDIVTRSLKEYVEK